jgi:hypothetical protein
MNRIKIGLFPLSGLQFICAREGAIQDSIPDDFAGYSEPPREASYVHLNKSVFIKGKDQVFKVYANWLGNNFFLGSTC